MLTNPKCKSKSLFYFDFSQRKLLGLSKETTTKIEQWVQNGGTLIAYQDAIKWLNTAKLIELTLKQIKMKLKTLALKKDDLEVRN
jgi:hypothetical protein